MIAKGDSCATNHYLGEEHKKKCQIRPLENEPSVLLPNNDIIEATDTGTSHLHLLSDLSPCAQTLRILPHLGTSLLTLSQFADDGCIIMLDKSKLCVFKNFKLLFMVTRNL